jgi:hypothetical protein
VSNRPIRTSSRSQKPASHSIDSLFSGAHSTTLRQELGSRPHQAPFPCSGPVPRWQTETYTLDVPAPNRGVPPRSVAAESTRPTRSRPVRSGSTPPRRRIFPAASVGRRPALTRREVCHLVQHRSVAGYSDRLSESPRTNPTSGHILDKRFNTPAPPDIPAALDGAKTRPQRREVCHWVQHRGPVGYSDRLSESRRRTSPQCGCPPYWVQRHHTAGYSGRLEASPEERARPAGTSSTRGSTPRRHRIFRPHSTGRRPAFRRREVCHLVQHRDVTGYFRKRPPDRRARHRKGFNTGARPDVPGRARGFTTAGTASPRPRAARTARDHA